MGIVAAPDPRSANGLDPFASSERSLRARRFDLEPSRACLARERPLRVTGAQSMAQVSHSPRASRPLGSVPQCGLPCRVGRATARLPHHGASLSCSFSRVATAPSNQALQLTANSAFLSRFGSLLAFNLGGSATLGGAIGRSWAPNPLGGGRCCVADLNSCERRSGLISVTVTPATTSAPDTRRAIRVTGRRSRVFREQCAGTFGAPSGAVPSASTIWV